jgi:transcriptional regulator GlxA family with amidase domain
MLCFRGELTLGVHKIPFLEFSRKWVRFVCGPQLADVGGLSPRQFGRVFYLRPDKLQPRPSKHCEPNPLELIEKTNDPIEMTAKSVGFSDPERMRRVFVRSFGNPPQAVRRMSRVEART